MRFSGIIGAILVLGIIIGDVFLAEDIFSFIYLPAFMVCGFGTLGLGYLSFGALDTLQAVSSLRLLIKKPGNVPDAERRAEVLAGLARHLWVCGATGSAISVLKLLEFAAREQAFLFNPNSILITALPLFYALLGSEFVLRPAAMRMQALSRGLEGD